MKLIIHLPTAEVKTQWIYTSTPPPPNIEGVQRDSLNLKAVEFVQTHNKIKYVPTRCKTIVRKKLRKTCISGGDASFRCLLSSDTTTNWLATFWRNNNAWTSPKLETVRPSASWCKPTRLHDVKPQKITRHVSNVVENNQILTSRLSLLWLAAIGSTRTLWCFQQGQYDWNSTRHGFAAFQNSLGWGSFLFWRRGKASPSQSLFSMTTRVSTMERIAGFTRPHM
jgi:hypothetical protein